MKTNLSVRLGIFSRRLLLPALILVASGSSVIIPADEIAHHHQAVEAHAGRAVARAQRLAAMEAAQARALGDRLVRTYVGVVLRVEHDLQRFFHSLRRSLT